MDKFFIDWAEKQLGGKIVVTKEPHGDQSTVYQLSTPDGAYFLKIAPELSREHERLDWISGKLPTPRVAGFVRNEDRDALLLTAIEGVNLAKLAKTWSAEKIVDNLAEVLRRFHATETKDCPFGGPEVGGVLVHGDACLPNFIFNGDTFSGYIDLGDMRVDAVEVDLSAAAWSLEYNLGQGHGKRFLEKYGLKDVTEDLVSKLRMQYEETQKNWGLV